MEERIERSFEYENVFYVIQSIQQSEDCFICIL